MPIREVLAETFLVDRCITAKPYDKPAAYLHVIMHDVAPIQTGSELIKEYGR